MDESSRFWNQIDRKLVCIFAKASASIHWSQYSRQSMHSRSWICSASHCQLGPTQRENMRENLNFLFPAFFGNETCICLKMRSRRWLKLEKAIPRLQMCGDCLVRASKTIGKERKQTEQLLGPTRHAGFVTSPSSSLQFGSVRRMGSPNGIAVRLAKRIAVSCRWNRKTSWCETHTFFARTEPLDTGHTAHCATFWRGRFRIWKILASLRRQPHYPSERRVVSNETVSNVMGCAGCVQTCLLHTTSCFFHGSCGGHGDWTVLAASTVHQSVSKDVPPLNWIELIQWESFMLHLRHVRLE